MSTGKPRIVGFELYFDRLKESKEFYRDVIGLDLTEDDPAHHAKFDSLHAFLCLECKGSESYPSSDKAVVFIEIGDLEAMVRKLGDRILQSGSRRPGEAAAWAVLHDPEGHNIVLLQAAAEAR